MLTRNSGSILKVTLSYTVFLFFFCRALLVGRCAFIYIRYIALWAEGAGFFATFDLYICVAAAFFSAWITFSFALLHRVASGF